jgi:DNA-binding GntR family transcriptional regulator
MCLNYSFWPRQQLHIEGLACILSSSATPVREALARLAGEGLIEAVPNRGYVAKMLCEVEMGGSIDLLFTLLTESIARCDLQKSWHDAAGEVPWKVAAEGAMDILAEENRLFLCISQMSRNEIICSQTLRLLELTRFVRQLDLESQIVATETRISLQGLLGHLDAADKTSALQNLHHHNRGIQHRLTHIVKEGRSRSMPRPARDMTLRRVVA